MTDKAGVATPCWAMGVAVGDYNNDGRPDLVVSCFGGVVLYRNNGDGTFTDVTKAAHLDKDVGWATGVTFGDYDGDGNSDLFVPHYVDLDLHDLPTFGSRKTCEYHEIAVQCGPRGLKGSPDSLYHNNGDGTFSDVAKQAGVDDANHYFGLGAMWSDFDNDGKLDLLVANDGEPNYLYHNEGNGRFKEVGYDAGIAVSEDGVEQANMGIALGDYMNNGLMKHSHLALQRRICCPVSKRRRAQLLRRLPQGRNCARQHTFCGLGDAFLDLNNSGWLDLIVVNGHVYPQVDSAKIGSTYREPKLVYQNQRNGTFREVGALTGTAAKVPQVSRGLAVGDLFNRGRLDIVIENLTGPPTISEAESDPANHWVSFELEGRAPNRLALNARVTVTTGKANQIEEVRSGGSYLSQSDLRLHFGLGETTRIDKVEVQWPNGMSQVFQGVDADRFYRLKQDGGLVTIDYWKRAASTRQ